MEVKNCKGCGRLYNYVSGVSYKNLCPKCMEDLEEKFQIAKKYIEENRGAGIDEVAEVADVKPIQIERWVREERLCFAEDSMIGVSCDRCGKSIRSGHYCNECKDKMTKTLGSAYGNVPAPDRKPNADKVAKMRFLDNQ